MHRDSLHGIIRSVFYDVMRMSLTRMRHHPAGLRTLCQQQNLAGFSKGKEHTVLSDRFREIWYGMGNRSRPPENLIFPLNRVIASRMVSRIL